MTARFGGTPDVLVIGAGVAGLTTAVCLAEAGSTVAVWTAEPSQHTTSAAAGAMWGPYLAQPADQVALWSTRTLEIFQRLATDPDTGVRLVSGVEASRRPIDPPAWARQLPGFAVCDVSELPTEFATGWRYVAPIIDMPVYLEYLQKRLLAGGGTVTVRRIGSLVEAATAAPVVVNCTGSSARQLVPDYDLTPVRGQLVVVDNPGISQFFTEDTGPSPDLLHIYPQGSRVVLGGTALPGVGDRTPDPSAAAAILERCAAVEPRLRDVKVRDHRVGLRPTRSTVRVEEQPSRGTRLLHNYGHAGAGVTLSWGCAHQIVNLLQAPQLRQ